MSKCDNMKKSICSAKKGTMKFLKSEWDVKDKSMIMAVSVMAGIMIGFMLSPIKGGLFSNNKIICDNTTNYIEDEEIDEI